MRPEVNLAKRLSKIFCLRLVSWEQRIMKNINFSFGTGALQSAMYDIFKEPDKSATWMYEHLARLFNTCALQRPILLYLVPWRCQCSYARSRNWFKVFLIHRNYLFVGDLSQYTWYTHTVQVNSTAALSCHLALLTFHRPCQRHPRFWGDFFGVCLTMFFFEFWHWTFTINFYLIKKKSSGSEGMILEWSCPVDDLGCCIDEPYWLINISDRIDVIWIELESKELANLENKRNV